MKERLLAVSIALGLVLALAVGTAAAERHVALGGDDAAPGSQAAPWRTLQHAVDAARPGEVILVHAGEYAGCRIQRSGAEGAWITLRAAPGERVVLGAPGPNNPHHSIIEVETWAGDGIVSYWIIQGLEVRGSPNGGLDLRGSARGFNHHIALRDNVVSGSHGSGIFAAFCHDLEISGNTSHGNGAHGVYVCNSGDRPRISRNLLHDNRACGLHMNGDAAMGGDGLISGALVEGNTIYQNGAAGGAAINLDGVVESVIRNNVIFANLAGGIAVFQGGGAQASRDLVIQDNTVRMPLASRWAVSLDHPDCTGVTIQGNLLYHLDPRRGAVKLPQREMPGLACDHNVVVDRFSVDDGGSLIGLAEWRALGHGAHSRLVTPADLAAARAGQ